MGQYLLSTYAVEGQGAGPPPTPEDMKTFMERVVALERQLEDMAARAMKAGAGQQADLLRVRASRLEAEIALEKLKARLNPAEQWRKLIEQRQREFSKEA